MMLSIPSSSPAALVFPLTSYSNVSARNQLSFSSVNFGSPKSYLLTTPRTFALPRVLETNAESASVEGDEDSSVSTLSLGAGSDVVAPKQKIRIKLRSYWAPLIEDSCKQIMDAARTTNAKFMGPVPLPTKREYTVF